MVKEPAPVSPPSGRLHFYRQGYSAITNFLFYRTIFDQPFSKTASYFLHLSIHTAGVITLIVAWHYGPQLLDLLEWVQGNIPQFEVVDGRLSVDARQPLVMRYPGEKIITFVFDTTSKNVDPMQLKEPAILFTEKFLYLRTAGETRGYAWKDFGDIRMDIEDFETLSQLFKWFYFPIGGFCILVYTIIAKSLSAIALALFALSASLRYGIHLPFQQRFTIALYSLTPAIVIDLAILVTGVVIPYLFILYSGTAIIYTYLATQKCVTSE